jgi:hypothetical protein
VKLEKGPVPGRLYLPALKEENKQGGYVVGDYEYTGAFSEYFIELGDEDS